MATLNLKWADDHGGIHIGPDVSVTDEQIANPKAPKTAKTAKTAKAKKPEPGRGPKRLATCVINGANPKVGPATNTSAAQVSCPDGNNNAAGYRCPLYGDGCYAEGGMIQATTKLLNKDAGMTGYGRQTSPYTPEDVALDEASALNNSHATWLKKRVNDWFRLHVVGDCVTTKAAQIVSAAIEQYIVPMRGPWRNVWVYTHAWRSVARSAWSSAISVLASCDTLDDIPEAHAKGFATCVVIGEDELREMGTQQNKKFGEVLKLDNGFNLWPCQYEIGKIVNEAEAKAAREEGRKAVPVEQRQCIDCKWCMMPDSLRKNKLVIAFAAHTPKSDIVAKRLIHIKPKDVEMEPSQGAEDTEAASARANNPAPRRRTSGVPAHLQSRVTPEAFGYVQPPYYEDAPTSVDAYNAGLEAGAKDRHVPADVEEVHERIKDRFWKLIGPRSYEPKKGPGLAQQFAAGYHDGMSGRYTASMNPHSPGVGTDDDASAMYEEFHGKESTERITVTDAPTYEDALSVLGELIEIKVHCSDGKRDYVLGFRKDGVLLATNPTGTQLYLVGGNQSLPLDTMGITGAQAAKTSVLIGEAFEITYRTRKGFDKFRETEYFHELGEETGVKPVLAYNTLNCEMELIGGAYETKDVGITN